MKAIESIKKAVEYIEEHFNKEISIAEISGKCFLSAFYFQRLFKNATGFSIEKYIKARRLAKASEMLQSGKLVHEAAIHCGFKSAEHFSRSFKELYNMNPSEYQKTDSPLYHVYKPEVLLQNSQLKLGEKYISNNIVLEIKSLERAETNLVGYEMFCPSGIEEPGIDNPGIAWDVFHKTKEHIKHRTQPPAEYGVSYKFNKKGFSYLAAVQVDKAESIPEDMVQFTLPEGSYISCVYESESFPIATSRNLKTAMDYFHHWFTKNKYKTAGNFASEYYATEAFSPPHQVEILAHVK